MRLLSLAALLISVPVYAQAPAKPTPGDEMIYKYLCAETDKLSQKFLDGAKSLEEWQKKRPRLYQEYMDMLGLWPIPEKTPLKAAITGSFEHEGVIIDKVHFQSKPGLYVTGNLYRPKVLSRKRLPTILYVCGHANKGRDGNKSAYQDHGLWFASNGYICLVLDTLQLGEIPGVHHGTYGRPWLHLKAYGNTDKEKEKPETRWWWHAMGYTPAGVEAWNGIRAIDYLLTRSDVDPDRIGVTGISGGGAATFWIACADDRVKVAVPVSGMSDLESYVKNKVVNGHCDCMFLYNTYQWDWTTIAALVAPRPMLFANSDNDPIFPMDGNRRIIEKLRSLYKMYNKPELVDDYVSVGGHAYRPDLRIAIFKFINKHLKNDTTTPVKDADFKLIEGKLLRVFATDDDVPKDAINAKIDESFVPRAKVELPQAGRFDDWKRQLVGQVKDRSFRYTPEWVHTEDLKGYDFMIGRGGGGAVAYVSDFERFKKVQRKLEAEPLTEFANQYATQNESFLLFFSHFYPLPRKFQQPIYSPEEKWTWTKKTPPNYVERSNVLLGYTIDGLKVHSLARDIKKSGTPKVTKLIAQGHEGILAAYATIIDPHLFDEITIIDPPVSHKEGPYFLNVLRVLDIPEALGLLAPHVKLTLINAKGPAFERTAEIYRRAGAAERLVLKKGSGE